MNTQLFTPNIDSVGFPEPPSLSMAVGGEHVWSTKQLQNIDQRDSNNNRVTDFVESNKKSLTLTNIPSAKTLEPTQTLRIDSTLENVQYRINDDQSNIRLEIVRIDDLDEKKSYSSQDDGWRDIQDRYVSISGSDRLKDGHAVWVFSARNNRRTRITYESRIYSGKDVLLRSERNSILIGTALL
jgi:hypothetical protein